MTDTKLDAIDARIANKRENGDAHFAMHTDEAARLVAALRVARERAAAAERKLADAAGAASNVNLTLAESMLSKDMRDAIRRVRLALDGYGPIFARLSEDTKERMRLARENEALRKQVDDLAEYAGRIDAELDTLRTARDQIAAELARLRGQP